MHQINGDLAKEIIDLKHQIQQQQISPDDEGHFANIYFSENIAIKEFFDCETDGEYDAINNVELDLEDEAEILISLSNNGYYPIYYESDDAMLVMERIKGISLDEYYMQYGYLPLNIFDKVISILEATIQSKWIPYDIHFRHIYICNQNEQDYDVKIIDVGMFQKYEVYKSIIEEKGVNDFLNKYLQRIFDYDMSYINDLRKYEKAPIV